MSNADIRGQFIWHELMTTDPDSAAAFYLKVVPWKTQDSGMPSYTLWMAGKTRAGGLTTLPESAESCPPHWLIYIATPDVDATEATVQRLGGKVLKSASDIPSIGRFAVLADPQGATFAIFTPLGPPPEGSPTPGPDGPGPGEFSWHELAATDPEAALWFYEELFGWEKGPTHDMGPEDVYQIITHHGVQVGGIYKLRGPSTPSHWLSYVRVADCAKATAAAKAAGGRVLNGPMEVPGGSWITMLVDPQGGAFAVVERPKAQAQKPTPKAAPKVTPKGDKSKASKPAAKKKVAKKPAAKKKAAKKQSAAKRAPAKRSSAKRGKSAAKKKSKATAKRAKGKKAKRR